MDCFDLSCLSDSAVVCFFGNVGTGDGHSDFLRIFIFVGAAPVFTSVVLHLDVEVFTNDTTTSGGADLDFFNIDAFVDAAVHGLEAELLRESDNT